MLQAMKKPVALWVLALVVLIRCQEQEHFLDVRQIVKGTIEAMQRLPEAAIQANTSSTAKPDDLMSLFKLPADIMTNLAVGAGYLEEPQTSTYGPWIVAREKKREEEDSDSWEEIRKKKKKRPEDDGLVNLKDLLRLPAASAPPLFADAAPTSPRQDPLYRKEVSADGQVHFVPVYPSAISPPSTPSPFMMVTPLISTLPKRVQQSNQRFEAQTFPPVINPFQNQVALPPRIIQAPQPVAQPATVTAPPPSPPQMQQVPAAEQQDQPSHPPVLVHPVIRNEERTKKPAVQRAVQTEGINMNSRDTSSDSSEDESIVHSEESEVFQPVRKSVISQTPLRVRTVDHEHIQRNSFKEERVKLHKKPHPAKKRVATVRMPPMDDEPVTQPPMAGRPTPMFEEAMADIERPRINRRRRVHASKTLKIGRHVEEMGDTEERMSVELEQLPSRGSELEQEEDEEQSVEVTTRPPRRRSRLWKKQTIRPKSKFLTTTETPTTTEEEETTTEMMKRKKKRKNTEKKKIMKKYKRRRTTVALRTSTPAVSTFEVTAQHCANIRSFARQFGFFDLRKFARKHCDYIENYYSELTCDRVDEYAEECQKLKRN